MRFTVAPMTRSTCWARTMKDRLRACAARPPATRIGIPRGYATEAVKARYIGELTKSAAQAYSKILTRYPLMDRSEDAKKRLASLHQPIPRPTKAAVAQNKAELNSRGEATTVQKMMGLLKKGRTWPKRPTSVSRLWSSRLRSLLPRSSVRKRSVPPGVGEKGATVRKS